MTLRRARKIDPRVTDPDEFDRAIVRSVLAFYNELASDDDKLPFPKHDSQLANLAFGWLPAVMEQRALHERLDPARLLWNPNYSLEGIGRAQGVLLYMVGAFRGKAEEHVTLAGRRISREQWYQETVEGIEYAAALRVIDGETRRVELPLLTGIEQCVGYALAVIRTKNLERLIRPCQFLRKDFKESRAHHLFLADDPRQKFCSRAHSNAFRQREWRRDHATPRRSK